MTQNERALIVLNQVWHNADLIMNKDYEEHYDILRHALQQNEKLVSVLRGLSTISSNPVQICDTFEYRAVRTIALNALQERLREELKLRGEK